MCGRYKLEEHWQEYCANPFFDWDDPPWPTPNPLKGSDAARPTDPMPVIRRNDAGRLVPEMRRWGYLLLVDGKTVDPATGRPKKVKRAVINAMSEKLTSSPMWKRSFGERRCLVPMSSWDEWPETGAGKQQVRVSMTGVPVFMAAGLYDVNTDPRTGDAVSVYTVCTVPPNEFLGTVHDRAPMVLLPSQYVAWLNGGDEALKLVGAHPDASAFEVAVV